MKTAPQLLRSASVFGALALVAVAGCRSAPSWMQNGMLAPELVGTTVEGRTVKLSEQRGKVVVVVFFADWCPHCRALYADEREVATRMKSGKFTLLGVLADDAMDAFRGAIAREHVTWPVIDDAGRRNSSAWGVTGIPTIYVLDADGVIRGFDLTGSTLLSTVDALIAGTRTAP